MLRDLLRGEGIVIGRRWCARRCADVHRGAVPSSQHVKAVSSSRTQDLPLLRGLAVERPNRFGAWDITYVPMESGFVYLAAVVAVVDWFTRRVLAWRLSITIEVDLP